MTCQSSRRHGTGQGARTQIARVYAVPGSGERTWLTPAGAGAAAGSAVSAGSRNVRDDILGGIGLRAGGDRVGVRPVEIAETGAVVSYLGIVCCLL